MGAFLKSTKGRITAISIALALVIAAVVLAIVLQPKDAYRSIVVKELEGTVLVSNDKRKDAKAYSGMALFDGDRIAVAEDSRLTIELDGDKYMLAEGGTRFLLEAAGMQGSDRTVIHLESGSALTRIKNKLTEDQSYVVKTPTSTISVRGTVYHVAVTQNEEGKSVTKCDAFDGVVEVTPIDNTGAPTEEPQRIAAGSSASVTEIRAEENDGTPSSAFVRDDEGNATRNIDYNDVSTAVIEELVDYIDDGEELDVNREQLEQYVAHEHTFAEDAWSRNETEHWHDATCVHTDLPSAIRGSVGKHTWNAGEVTKEATHTEEGIETFTCTVCGETRTEPIAKTPEHIWSDWISLEGDDSHMRQCRCGETEQASHTWNTGEVTKEATHTEEGIKAFACTACGAARTETIAKTAEHTWSNWISLEGDDSHMRQCRCGATEQVSHTWDAGVVTRAATHTIEGVRTYTCTVCDAPRTEAISKTVGHSWGDWEAEATNGTYHSRTCACGEGEQEEHLFDNGVETKAPTETELGIMTYTCSVCEFVRTEEIPMLEHTHTWSDQWSYNDTLHWHAATCRHTELSAEPRKDQAEHTFDGGKAGNAPTGAPATVYTCTVCGYEKYEAVHEHTWSDWTDAQTTDQHYRFCTDCQSPESYEYEEHTFGNRMPEETNGNNHYRVCNKCGKAQSEEHRFDSGVEGTAPDGGSAMVYTCADCGYTKYDELHEHGYGDWTSENDNTAYHSRSCSCGDTQRGAHDFGKGVEDRGPKGEVVVLYTCKDCGYSKQEEYHEHRYSNWLDCNDGTDRHFRICELCGLTDSVEYAGHSYDDWMPEKENEDYHFHYCECGKLERELHLLGKGIEGMSPDGENAIVYTCADCGYTEYEVTGDHQHEWEESYTGAYGQHFYRCKNPYCSATTGAGDCSGGTATCTEQAICTVCGSAYGELSPDNHDLEHHSAKEPTCTEIGWHEYDSCKREGCGYTTYRERPIEHHYTDGACDNCGAEMPPQYMRVDANGAEDANGEYILFGSYPQTDVTDMAERLGLVSGKLPTSSNDNGWTDYGYYQNGTNGLAYMWYKDVTIGADKYRAVYFSTYRPSDPSDSATAPNGNQFNNGYHCDAVYWFKFEPIKWKIQGEENGSAFLLSEMILDSREYQITYSGSNPFYNDGQGVPSGTYANNYEYSTVRAWLNDDFYNTAFTKLQREFVLATAVDNSAGSTSYSGQGSNPYACHDTNDKVFLPSGREALIYGYSNFSEPRMSTDYAKAQGCSTVKKEGEFCGNGVWILRSPYSAGSAFVYYINAQGYEYNDYVNYTHYGIVPALTLNLD